MERSNVQLMKENEELKSCIKWMMDCYKATLWNKPVKNLDEVFSLAESLIKEGRSQEGVREPVIWFAEQMEAKLKLNDGKGGWENCDLFWLIDRLKEEVNELENALYNHLNFSESKNEIVLESSDVGNYAMMIADITRKRLIDSERQLDVAKAKCEGADK